jgi:hypothetical protein
MGGRGTDGRKDVSRVGGGFAVGGTDITLCSIVYSFTSPPYFWKPTNIERRVSIRGDSRVVVAVVHDDGREQGYDNSRATPDGAIVVATFAMVLVSVTCAAVAVALRVAGCLTCSASSLVLSCVVDKCLGCLEVDTAIPATNECRRGCGGDGARWIQSVIGTKSNENA